MAGFAKESRSERALWYYATMRGMWGVEAPDEEIPPPLDYAILDSEGATQDLFASGYRALRQGDPQVARAHLEEIRKRLEAHRAGLSEEDSLSGGGGGTTSLNKATVLERSLAALIALDAGREDEALRRLDEATELEASLPLEFGPPDIIKPSHELYGEVLLGLDRPEEAIGMFEKALDRAPRRTAALFGLARAARGAGSQGGRVGQSTLASACARLEENTARGELADRARKLCSEKS
jgi:tetratricopeptide (TPR) repeat protein